MSLKIIPYLFVFPLLIHVSMAAGAEGTAKGESSDERGQQVLGQPGASPDSDKHIGPAPTDSATSSSDKKSKKSMTKSQGNKHDRKSHKNRSESGSGGGNGGALGGSTGEGVSR